MKRYALRLIFVLAILSIAGIFIIQFTFLKNIFEITEKELQETTTVALREVAWQILEASGQTSKFDNIDPVERVTTNYYLVNVNDIIDPDILRAQLKEQFKRHSIQLDFEYAIFDPGKKKMGYHEYVCAKTDSCLQISLQDFPLSTKYTYYFGVNFPKPLPFFSYRMQGWYFMTGLLLIVLIFFGYSLWVIIRQRQFSDIQKVFINNLTHELKTPISSIGLSAQVLNDHRILENPARLFEYVRIINEQSTRLARNVEKVLNLSTLDKNRLQLTTTALDLLEFTEKAIERFKESELSKNVTISVIKSSRGLMVMADDFHFGNIIQNILENAVKYCRRTPEIQIFLIREKKMVQMKFYDNGIGIPPEERKKIFTKFYRIPTGNIHDVKGFGLGLDYVKRIVQAHGWKVKVEGNETGGSVFTILIPLKNG
jgi:two-component system, OmpR family, phosphate regulon sensor histidine kinase PhoR